MKENKYKEELLKTRSKELKNETIKIRDKCTFDEWNIEKSFQGIREENTLKFYYSESNDSYYVGRRCGTMYYGEVDPNNFDTTFRMSRHLPWGKEHYPSEPKEISFNEWLKGFVEKNYERKKVFRYWFSYEQKKVGQLVDGFEKVNKVLIGNEWREYTEFTSTEDGKCNWDDAVLLAESNKELSIQILRNGGEINDY